MTHQTRRKQFLFLAEKDGSKSLENKVNRQKHNIFLWFKPISVKHGVVCMLTGFTLLKVKLNVQAQSIEECMLSARITLKNAYLILESMV